jgi:DNA mismatch repair protein MutL
VPIRRLPSLLVNQIAAGEVIERPASVVKELVENSIDAGATRITVEIENGGCDRVAVSDNGCGIPQEELELALAPHATSKIIAQSDLDAIGTLGFRGEALASIASVSRLTLQSRPASQASAGVIEAEGGSTGCPRPAGGPIGTTVTVRNLFFNTPARRKFLRTPPTEGGRIAETLESIALANHIVAFSLRADGRTVLDLPAGQAQRERALAVIGPELADELLEVRSETRGFSIWGLAGRPALARAAARHMRLHLNGRVISDRSINHAIREAYRGLIEPGRFPIILLFLQMDPSQVDVNVHPAKAEVRFRNASTVHSAVLSAVRHALRAGDLTPPVDLARAAGGWPAYPARELSGGSAHAQASGDASVEASWGRQFVEYFRRLDPLQKGFVYTEVKQAVAQVAPELMERERHQPIVVNAPGSTEGELPIVRAAGEAMQVHSSYIVTQDAQGLVIIDQHALHERVLFEKLKARLEQGTLESQRLLMPAPVEAGPSQMEALESLQPVLRQLGIEAEPLGPAVIGVQAFTSLLFDRGVEPGAFLRELLDRATGGAPPRDPEAALHEVLDMMACKAAVKAGDKLSPHELAELLQYRELVERSSNCPHGRPTTLRLTIRDLDRQFGRT